MSDRPRDTQRSKLYAAERDVFDLGHRHLAGQHFYTLEAIDEYLRKVAASVWFKSRWPHVGLMFDRRTRTDSTTWTIKDGRGRRRAGGGLFVLTFPVTFRYEEMVLHELTHHIIERETGQETNPWHGWLFCSNLLELVYHEMGKEAGDALKAAYKERKVKFRKPRVLNLTDEQRFAERDRLNAAKAAS